MDRVEPYLGMVPVVLLEPEPMPEPEPRSLLGPGSEPNSVPELGRLLLEPGLKLVLGWRPGELNLTRLVGGWGAAGV